METTQSARRWCRECGLGSPTDLNTCEHCGAPAPYVGSLQMPKAALEPVIKPTPIEEEEDSEYHPIVGWNPTETSVPDNKSFSFFMLTYYMVMWVCGITIALFVTGMVALVVLAVMKAHGG